MSALLESIADVTAVTVWLSPAKAARLEMLISNQRAQNASLDDNDVVDAVFSAGLHLFEQADSKQERDPADTNVEALFDQVIAQHAYIVDLLARVKELKAAAPITGQAAIERLQELMIGTGAALQIIDGDLLLGISFGPSGETLNVKVEELIELLDALTVIQNIREAE